MVRGMYIGHHDRSGSQTRHEDLEDVGSGPVQSRCRYRKSIAEAVSLPDRWCVIVVWSSAHTQEQQAFVEAGGIIEGRREQVVTWRNWTQQSEEKCVDADVTVRRPHRGVGRRCS